MVFFGQIISNVVTLVLFACSLFIVLRHTIHSVQAMAQIMTSGAWGRTSADLLTRRVATSFGILLAMTSSFGLHWWLTMGSVPGTVPRVPHLDEFLNHFLSRFVSGLFGEYPWLWDTGWLGTTIWGVRLLLLVGSAAFVILLLRNALDARIRDRSAVWRVPLNVLGGFLAMAMVTYWWPAGMGDRPFFTVVMVILCFMVLGAVGGAMQGNSSPSSASSARSPSGGWDETQSRPKKASDEDEYATDRRKRDEKAARDSTKKWHEDERKGWEKRDKDEKQRREDEAEKQRKDKDREDERRREQNRKDADDLAWRLKEEAKKEEWKAEQRRKDDEHRRKQ